MRIKKIALTLMCITILFSTNVYAASDITKEYTFTTNKNYKEITVDDIGKGELANIYKEIAEDGKKYKATTIEITNAVEKKQIKKEKKYDYLVEKQVPQTIKKNGENLKLKEASYSENKRSAATGTLTYKGRDKRPDAPLETDITANLNGQTITVTGYLTAIKKTGSSYSKPFSVKGRFIGDADVNYYLLGDSVRWPNNPSTPAFAGYESAIANNLGLGNDYKITGAKWTGDYITEDEQTVRYAEFTGLRKANDWTAYYEEKLTADSPNLTTYNAIATYTNGIEKTSYDVTVTVLYEKTGWTLLEKIIAATVGIIIIAGLVALILIFLRRKKGEESDEYKNKQ